MADGRRGGEIGEDYVVTEMEVPKDKKYSVISKAKPAESLIGKGMNRESIDVAVKRWMEMVLAGIRK